MSELILIETTLPGHEYFNNDLRTIEALGESTGLETQRIPYTFLNEPRVVERIKDAHAFVVGGVPYESPQKAEDLTPLFSSIAFSTKRSLWICYGLQILALAHGGTMRRNEEIERGRIAIKVKPEHTANPAFAGLGNDFEVESLHSGSVDIQGTSLLRLASSHAKPGVSPKGCENQIICASGNSQRTYGIQGHPEKQPSEKSKLFIWNILRLELPHSGSLTDRQPSVDMPQAA